MRDQSTIPQAVKAALEELYGDRLSRVILYGSRARGDWHEESDWDFLVVLRDEKISIGDELWRMSEPINRLNLFYRTWISSQPVTLKNYNESQGMFYHNVRRDGIEL